MTQLTATVSPGPSRVGHTPLPHARSGLRRALQRRHPGDALRVVLGLGVLVGTAVFVKTDSVGPVETNVFRLINDFPLPGWLYPVVWTLMQFGNIGSVPATALAAAATKRWRMALDFAVAGGTIYLVAKLVKDLVLRGRPQTLLDAVHILGEPARGLGYVSGHTAVAVALATVAAPYLGRRSRRLVWLAAGSVAFFRIYVGAHLPLDVLGGAGLGWAAGAAAHLALGAPEGHVSAKRVRKVLERLGFAPVSIEAAGEPTRRSSSFSVTSGSGPDLFVKVMARERRDDDVLYRAWRWLQRRPGRSPSSQVDREAAMGLLARSAGVRAPAVLYSGSFGNGAGLLIQEWVEGSNLSESAVDPPMVWEQVAALHAAGIAHGDLSAQAVMVGTDGKPWIVGYASASAAATADDMARDMKTLSATLAGSWDV